MSRRKRSASTRFSLFAFQDIITCVMGIMLLLTLLLCLQITEAVMPSSAEVQTRSKTLHTMVSSLQTELSSLEDRVRTNAALLNSGALSNTNLLQEKQQESDAGRKAAERELMTLLQESLDATESLNDLKSSTQQKQMLQDTEIAQLIAEALRQQQSLKDITDGKRIVYNRYVGSADTCWIVEVSSDTDFKAAPIGKKVAPVSFTSAAQVLKWIRERHKEGAEFLLLLKPAADSAMDELPGTLREEGIAHGFDLIAQEQSGLDPVTGAESP